MTTSKNLRLCLLNKGFSERSTANQRIDIRNGAFDPLDVNAHAFEDGGLEGETVGASTARFKSHEHGFLKVIVEQTTDRQKRKESKENPSIFHEGERKTKEKHQTSEDKRPKRLFVTAHKCTDVGQRRRDLIHAEHR